MLINVTITFSFTELMPQMLLNFSTEFYAYSNNLS